jgi:glutaredoxin
VAWVLYSRRGCHLCEAAEDLLAMLRPGVTLVDVDVDADPATRDRYGLRVPVLEIDGMPMVEGRFDETEVARLVARG